MSRTTAIIHKKISSFLKTNTTALKLFHICSKVNFFLLLSFERQGQNKFPWPISIDLHKVIRVDSSDTHQFHALPDHLIWSCGIGSLQFLEQLHALDVVVVAQFRHSSRCSRSGQAPPLPPSHLLDHSMVRPSHRLITTPVNASSELAEIMFVVLSLFSSLLRTAAARPYWGKAGSSSSSGSSARLCAPPLGSSTVLTAGEACSTLHCSALHSTALHCAALNRSRVQRSAAR